VPKLTYEITHNNSIVVLKFHTKFRKNFFKEQIQPAIDFMKALVPGPMRTYNPTTHLWEIAFEYWGAVKTAYETVFKFVCTEGSIAGVIDPLKNQSVPKDYAENFHYKQEAIVTKESTESIVQKLSEYLGVKITTQDVSELKKLYRAKARELHPDLGGEAAKMSELNRLWTLYSAGGC
jgi:hypothetical protein